MADASDLQEWELLSSHSSEDPKAFEGLDGEGDSYGGAIELDYFSLDSENRRIEKASLEEESEGGGLDSDNPTRVDPGSDSRDMERSRGEVVFTGSGSPVKNFGGFLSDGSSDYRSLPADSERGEPGNKGDSVTEVHVEGTEAGHQDPSEDESEKSLDFGGSGGSEGIETGHEEHGLEESGELVKMGDSGGSEGIETGHEEHGLEESGELVKMGDGSGSSESVLEESGELVKMVDGSGSSESVSNSEGEKKVLAWWKMPLDFIKFYVFKTRPVWSISIAAAIMGFVMLGRKLHKMKHKSRTIQLKIALDDKRVSQLKLRAARLNEAFTVVRRVPIIRRVPAGGVTEWPVVNLR